MQKGSTKPERYLLFMWYTVLGVFKLYLMIHSCESCYAEMQYQACHQYLESWFAFFHRTNLQYVYLIFPQVMSLI